MQPSPRRELSTSSISVDWSAISVSWLAQRLGPNRTQLLIPTVRVCQIEAYPNSTSGYGADSRQNEVVICID